MALYWLDLSNISRKQAPGTLLAHGNYILRKSARNHVISVNFPTNPHAIKRELEAYENWAIENTRKDSRLVYKIMHALPVELSRDAQIEATRRFLWSLTMRGRGRAFAAFHDLGTHNPHVHITFIDRDVETGKSVALLSANMKDRAKKGLEPNSTEWVRQLWEFECNGVLAEQGLDVRIDRRSNLERGLGEAQKKRGYQAVEEEPIEPTEPEQEAPQEEEMVGAIENLTPRESAIAASEFYHQLRELRALRANLDAWKETIAVSEKQLDISKGHATAAYTDKETAEKRLFMAEQKLADFRNENGRLKGFEVNLGFMRWKSPTRKGAEQAENQYQALQAEFDRAEHTYKSSNDQVQRWENTTKEQQDKLEETTAKVEQMLSHYGDHATLQSAENTLEYTAHAYLDGITLEDLEDCYEAKTIGFSTYRDALEILGEHEKLRQLEEEYIETLENEMSGPPDEP